MGLFSGLARAVVAVAVLPVDVVADIATLGGVNTGQDEPYTAQRARKIMDALNEATDRDGV